MSLSQYSIRKVPFYSYSLIGKQSGIKYLMSLLTIVLIFLSTGAKAQSGTRVTAPLTGSYATGDYYNYSNGEILLNPGFESTPGTGQQLQLYIYNDPCPPLSLNPSADQNYVATYVPRDSLITDASQLAGRSPCNVMQSIAYFDGLGRPLQTVQVNASPTLRDIVQPFVYDQFGREVTKYLPYASASANNGSYKVNPLSAQAGFYTGTADVVNTAYPYAQTLFEPSPLNRVEQQGAPGAAWQPGTRTADGGRTVTLEYTTNNNTAWSTDNVNSRQVRLFTATVNNDFSQTLATTTNYNANTLYVTVTKDENWTSGRGGTTEEYKDNSGKVVLKRTYNYNTTISTLEKLSTYYVYDDFGNLAFVLPPGADPDNATITPAILNNFCYQYQYDQRNRLINKRVPGKGWEETIYNKLDQVIFTQDAVQRAAANPMRSFIKYDGLGRVIMSGVEMGHTITRSMVQAIVDASTGRPWEERLSGGFQDYTNTANPGNIANMNPLIVNYYDTTTGITSLPVYAAPGGATTATTGLVVASKVAVLGARGSYNAPVLWTRNYYDDNGRNIVTYKQHYVAGTATRYNYDALTTTYNFNDQPLTVKREHYIKNPDGTAAVLQLTLLDTYVYDHMGRTVQTKNKVNALPEVILSKTVYNEIGQLKTKSLHSEDGSSFLQDVNYTYNERGWLKEHNNVLFNEVLSYNNGLLPQFNGNISGMSYTGNNSGTKAFNYTYDNLNRLKNAALSSGTQLNEAISYDVMGNISSLTRGGQAYTALSYAYTGNQLTGVSGTGFTARTYAYDVNGNATTAGTTNRRLAYNDLNLPFTVKNSSNTTIMTYTYAANGDKLRSVSTADGTREYISGINYTGTAISSIATAEGRITHNSGVYSYQYDLKDHLGNVRVTFDKGPGGAARVLQEDEYYAFGLRKPLYDNSSGNRYLYNGKELQVDLANQYDYGARFYDPVIGRWTSVDPLAEIYRRWSPYNYGVDNPIRFIDPDGMGVAGCCEVPAWMSDASDIFSGATSAYLSDFTGGNIETNYNSSSAYNYGKFLGHSVATMQGAAEVALGNIAQNGGLAAAPETAGTGLVVAAVGFGVKTHGVFMTANALSNTLTGQSMVNSVGDAMSSNKEPNGNSSASQKPQHGYSIRDVNTHEVKEFGISGQVAKRDATGNFQSSPRIQQKLSTKYKGNKSVYGKFEAWLKNRKEALKWEKEQVQQFKDNNGGEKPEKQIRP